MVIKLHVFFYPGYNMQWRASRFDNNLMEGCVNLQSLLTQWQSKTRNGALAANNWTPTPHTLAEPLKK